jgi:ferredoxin
MTSQIAQIDASRCSGCGRCISACALRLFAFETRHWKKISVMHDADLCNACGACVARCAIAAVSLVDKPADIITNESGC